MTKEQEKSLEKIKRQILIGECEKNIGIPVYISDLKNVLSMLEEKDKQIYKLKKHNDDLLRKLRNRVKDVKKLQKYSLYKKEFSGLNKQLQNKDKIIDEMAEQLAGLTIFDIDKDEPLILGDKEDVERYFKEKVKEIK